MSLSERVFPSTLLDNYWEIPLGGYSMKMCVDCNETKPLEMFVKDKNKLDGTRNRCKKCENLKRRKTSPLPDPRKGHKYCMSCMVEKPMDSFNYRYIKYHNEKRPFSYCKECEREKDSMRYENFCKDCGKVYRTGRKKSTHCAECYHSKHLSKNSRLHLYDWSGENNPMHGVQRFGENNPNYKPDITPEERERGRLIEGYGVWRKAVYERDNYTCQRCGDDKGGNLEAHHLDGYSWCKEKRLDIDNGITLCNTCHSGFHKKYGIVRNTREQFEEYLKYHYQLSAL